MLCEPLLDVITACEFACIVCCPSLLLQYVDPSARFVALLLQIFSDFNVAFQRFTLGVEFFSVVRGSVSRLGSRQGVTQPGRDAATGVSHDESVIRCRAAVLSLVPIAPAWFLVVCVYRYKIPEWRRRSSNHCLTRVERFFQFGFRTDCPSWRIV